MLTGTALLATAALQAFGGPRDDARAGPAVGPPAEAPVPAARSFHDGSARELEVVEPRVPGAEIRVDGRLDEPAWRSAPVLHGFTQYEPREGAAASQRTRIRVLLSDEAVHFAVEAFDDEPDGIRASLSERDAYGDRDDFVRILLDTFHDRRRAFVFQVNPLGVQADGLWLEGRDGRGDPIDWNPDFLWESAGGVDRDRYTVEMRIPLKSLRFPSLPVQDWGLQIQRTVQRTGYESSWAPLSRDRANRLAQAGRLSGLRDLDAGLFLEVSPFVTGNRIGEWSEGADAFRRDPVSGAAGFDVTYGLTSNLTLDGTVNPDFSQVEADAGRITVNERFDLRLPEKRPFFLEGTDVFAMPADLVYTRSIADPLGAAKISGKVGGFGVAYLGAVEAGGAAGGDPMINLVRVQRDLGRSSTAGILYADRTRSGVAFNRVVGADGRFVLGERYTVEVLAAGSADAAPGEANEWGSLFLTRVERAGRNLSLRASLEDVDEAFRARSGFVRRTGVTEAEGRVAYRWRGGPGALVERWGPSLEVEGTWSRDDFWSARGPEEAQVEVGWFASLRGNVGGYVAYSRSAFTVGAPEYEGLFVAGGGGGPATPFRPEKDRFQGLDRLRLRTWIDRWERVGVSLGASWSETPVFEGWRGLPADVAESREAEVDLSLRPTGSLSGEVGMRHSTIVRKGDGASYASATIPRIRARYQFTRSLFARATGEYAAEERGAVLDPETGRPLLECGDEACSPGEASASYDLAVEGLVGYEPSPGTVVFVGYSRVMSDARSFRFRNLTPRADGLFVKLSYRFRM